MLGFFTWVYATIDFNLKLRLWQHLVSFSKEVVRSWMCIRDFNEIVDDSEKVGGCSRKKKQFKAFNNMISDANLIDLGFIFTWANRRFDGAFMKEMIDKGFVSEECLAKFPKSKVIHELPIRSDHATLVVKSVVKKKFKIENLWRISDKGEGIVKDVWAKHVNRGCLKDLMSS